MIRFKKILPKRIAKSIKKSDAGKVALNRLDSFLNVESDEPVVFLQRFHDDQRKAITYKELREAVLNGYISEKTIQDWQSDYCNLVAKKWAPVWINAMEAASAGVKDDVDGFFFDYSWVGITDWIKKRAAQYVTNSTEIQKDSIRAMLARAYNNGESPEELSRVIRPCIGLTKQQSVANVKYYDHVKSELLKNNPNMRETTAAKRAREAAAKYAERQHRYRADTIAQTEMAYAYNYGLYASIKMAQEQGLLGEVRKVWSTSYDKSVCKECGALENKEVDIDGLFAGKYPYPPAHPRCRCAFYEKEVRKPQPKSSTLETSAENAQLEFLDEKTIERVLNDAKNRPREAKLPIANTEFQNEISATSIWNRLFESPGFSDATEEYRSSLQPGNGRVLCSEGYDVKIHQKEVEAAGWLRDTFGGDVVLLDESKENGVMMPDILWLGKLWDLKSTTTAKAANSAIRHGLRQIRENPGGIILDYEKHDFSIRDLEAVLKKRIKMSAKHKVDIIIKQNGTLLVVIRYEPKESARDIAPPPS